MLEENQRIAGHHHGIEEQDSSFTGPYRHKGYKRTLNALRDTLEQEGAVILKGVEGTGKTTLVAELISEYQHKGVPVAVFDKAMTRSSQFYGTLADTLSVPKQKNDLVRALRNTKAAGQFCLVVIDQEAINSSPEVADALQKLCLTSETTAGAIKLVVVRKDYLVIHTEDTPSADFHNWISREVTLDPLHTDDIEGYIYYLAAMKGIQPTPYEIGTDFMMIEKTEGRISRLKALLLPLIHKDVITRSDFTGIENDKSPLHSSHSGLFALAFALILAVGLGINHFFFTTSDSNEAGLADNPSEQPIFAEPNQTDKVVTKTTSTVQPPSTSQQIKVEKAVAAEPISLQTEEELPILDQSLADNRSTDEPAPQAVTGSDAFPVATPKQVEQPTANNTTTEELLASEQLASMNQKEFQAAVQSQLTRLEQQLADAKAENDRLKQALSNATTTQIETKQNETQLTAKPPVQETEAEATSTLLANVSTPLVLSEQKNKTDSPVSAGKDQISDSSAAVVATEIVTTHQDDQNNTPESNADEATVIADEQPLQQALATINAWQQAWQGQDHANYVDTYISGFNGAYKTHQQWLKKRNSALTKPEWIKLTRGDLHNIEVQAEQVLVDFWLTYEAATGYKDKTLKRLTVIENNGQWLIQKEQNLEVKPFF